MKLLSRLLVVFLGIAIVPAAVAQNTHTVTGIVIDAESGATLPGVTVRLLGTKRGTYSDSKGRFRLPLPAGEQRVAFSSVGYSPYETTFNEKTGDITIRLTPAATSGQTIQITAEPTADDIIERAIKKKEENRAKTKSFDGVLYSKFIMEIEGNLFGQIEEKDKQMIMETFSHVYADRVGQRSAVKILQRRQTANIPSGDNLLAIGNFVSFYDETVQLMNTVISSPLASDAFSYYTYDLKRRIPLGDTYIYEIEVTPSTTLFPAFVGTIRIAGGSYSLIEADLRPSEDTHIAYVHDLHLRQKFEQFPGDIWQPTLLAIDGRANVQVVAGFAEIDVAINVNSMYTDVHINEPIPDSVFQNRPRTVTVAENADSSQPEFWENNSLSVQSEREKEIYHHVDSVVANTPPQPGSDADTNFRVSLMPVLSYNRVSSLMAGAGFSATYQPVTLSARGSYSIGIKDVFGSVDMGVRLFQTTGASISVGGSVFSQIAPVPLSTPYPDILNTFYTAVFHDDYNDYLREDGWSARLFGTISDLDYMFEGRFSRHFCEDNTTSFSIFSSDDFRSNPVIQSGNYRVMRGALEWGNYGTTISISSSLRADISARLIGVYGEEQTSGLAFRSAEAGVRTTLPTFYTGYMPMSLDINISAGKGSDNLPRQFQFMLGRRMPVFGMFGHFSSAPIGGYGGTEFISAYAEHNFSDFFWRMLGLPEYEGRGIEFILEGGAAMYRHTAANMSDYIPTGDKVYSEVGFGLGKIPTFISNVFFLRVDALWGVGPLAKGRFGMTATLSSPF